MQSTRLNDTRFKIATVICVAFMVTALGTIFVQSARAIGSKDSPTRGVVMSESADRAASSTASDWIARADHVVVATVVDEVPLEPAESEIERGEGLIQRDLKFRVEKVVWSTSAPAWPAPEQFDWLALGWLFKGTTDLTKSEMTGAHEPRFELGHTYILALEWEPAVCSDTARGQWRGLGSGALLPYDNDRIGEGELEGDVVDVDTAQREWSNHGALLAEQVAGMSSDDLAVALQDEARKTAPTIDAATSC